MQINFYELTDKSEPPGSDFLQYCHVMSERLFGIMEVS